MRIYVIKAIVILVVRNNWFNVIVRIKKSLLVATKNELVKQNAAKNKIVGNIFVKKFATSAHALLAY